MIFYRSIYITIFFYFHKNRNVKQSFRETILMKVLFCELQLEYIHKVRGGLRRVESKLMMTIIKRQFFIRPGIANVNTERILCSLFHVYCWLFWKYRGSPDSTNFGFRENCVIGGIVLIGDWFSTKTHEIGKFT